MSKLAIKNKLRKKAERTSKQQGMHRRRFTKHRKVLCLVKQQKIQSQYLISSNDSNYYESTINNYHESTIEEIHYAVA